MSDVFKALSDPTRREILQRLSQKPTSVNHLAEHFNMSRPAVSKHLKVLTESKLVNIQTDKHDGRQRNCYAQLEALNELEEYLQNLRSFWKTKLGDLENYLQKESGKSNKPIS